MKVLVICEFSGAVRDAFIRAGHDAWSNDILPPEGKYPEKHFMTDDCWRMKWDLIIAHPPCTFLANSGVRWLYGGKGNRRDPVRWKNMEDGAAFFNSIAGLRCKRIVIENPIMHGHARKLIVNWPTQIIQPWMFGHGETKATELHLKGVPHLYLPGL